MSNFNYLDFIKIPSPTDSKLSIKDKDNVVKYTINPTKIISSSIMNNNIKILFKNADSILIDFNSISEAKIAISTLETYIQTLIYRIPYTNLTAGTFSIIDSFDIKFRSVKYLVSCALQGGTHSVMTCEITLSNSSLTSSNPTMSVYGVISTSGSPFVTFNARRKSTDTSVVELIALTSEINCYTSLVKKYII